MEGREEEEGLTSNGRDMKGRETGRKRNGRGRRKGREQPALTIKSRSCALASKHQFGRPVKNIKDVMALNGFRHKADAVKPQIPKPITKLSLSIKARWPMPTTSSAFVFKTKFFHNMPRSRACKRLFCYVLK